MKPQGDAVIGRNWLLHASGLLLAVVAALFLTALAVLAYWTMTGHGSNGATAGSLNPPANVAATMPNPNVRTLHVTWTGQAAPNGGTPDGYYVQRFDGSTPSPACGSSPASLLSGSAASCNDTAVPSGTYTYVVTAVFRSWTAASSASGSVTVPAPALASFTVVPSTTSPVAGTPFNVTITAFDQYGATFTGYTGAQCVTFANPHNSPNGTSPAYPAKGSCGSGSSVTFVSGGATVPVTLVDVETTTLAVTDNPTGKSGTSAAITITAATAVKLVFTQQPSTPTVAGVAFTTQPKVAIQDTYGNTVTGNTSSVTLAVTGGGATVTCTTNPLPAVSGVASFAGCKVTKAGTWTFTATDGALTSAVSNSFTITAAGATTIAVYSGSPQSATVATAFTNPLVALVTDTYGNPVSGVVVTFTPPGSGASGTFSGGNTATTDANGRATSNTFTANTVAGTYTVGASAPGTNTVNFSETNNPGAATTIAVYSGSPQSATVATAFTNPLVALVTDTYGNPVSGVVVTFTPPGSGASGTFSGGNTATTDANGRATSNTFTANTVAGTYTVGASAPGTGTASFSLTNNPGTAVKLVFTQQPSTPTVAGVAFTTQPKVAIQDTYGNTVTGNTSSVTLAVTGGGATVTCTTNPLPAVSGVASFAGCKVTKAGTWTFTATDGALTSAVSNSFTITAAGATTIAVYSGSPQSATVATAFTNPLVALVTDTYGNPVSGVVVTFTPPGSGASGTFSGGNTATTDANGRATSNTFTANTVAGTYNISATASGTGTASFSLTNNPGTAVKLVFTQQPSTPTVAGVAFTTQPKVAIQDTYGNTVTGNTSSVTLKVTVGGATVPCTTNPLPAVSGVASFAGCKMTAAGTYTLTATDGSLTSAQSNSFTITAATNLSQGKPVTCSSVEQVAFACAYAVDGNAGTRWSSAFSDPQWIYVDLGQSYNITQVVLMWEAAYGKSFQIQTSNDLTNWTTIYSTTTGTGGTQTLNSSNGLSSGSGRYVRMYGTVRGTQYGYSLYEFQVFGG